MLTHILFINSWAQKKDRGLVQSHPVGHWEKPRFELQCGSNYIIIPAIGTSYQSLNKDSLNSVLLSSEG